MSRILSHITILFCLLFTIQPKAEPYQAIEWVELMPEEDLQILLNPPESVLNIEDGSEEDSLDDLNFDDPEAGRYYSALKSARVVEALNGKKIKIPGFIVPLATDKDHMVTEFFIVPYFGACLHMPPPPPNQIVHAKTGKGIEVTSPYDAFWFEGELKIATLDHELGTSAYHLVLDKFYLYEE